MDKQSKKIIKYFSKESFDFYLNLGTDLEYMCEKLQIDWDSAIANLNYLSEQKYLSHMYSKKGTFYGYRLTHKGRNKLSFDVQEIVDFLLKSIVTPIVVSVITSIICFLILGK